MRLLLPLLAVLGLLFSPASASAAAAACLKMNADAMAAMSMGSASDDAGEDHPCCDDKAPQKPATDQDCAKACAAMCGVVAALPEPTSLLVAPVVTTPELRPLLEPRTHAPPGARRPPKLIA